MSVYRAKRKELKMPMDEDHLTQLHGEIQVLADDMLRSASVDVQDTQMFHEAQAKLSRQIADEWVGIRSCLVG